MDAETWEFLRAYKYAQQGCFPDPGGWMDQSRVLIEAIEQVESERVKIQKEQAGER